MNESESLNALAASTKKPLTREELLEIWQQDKYWGVAGISLTYDPYTGIRTIEGKQNGLVK
jgi:hypothetical protein